MDLAVEAKKSKTLQLSSIKTCGFSYEEKEDHTIVFYENPRLDLVGKVTKTEEEEDITIVFYETQDWTWLSMLRSRRHYKLKLVPKKITAIRSK